MNRNTVEKVKKYVNDNVLGNWLQVNPKVIQRNEGKMFTIQEHIEGMILAMISYQDWKNIAYQKDKIKELFFNYEPKQILKHDGNYYYEGLHSLWVSGRFGKIQMQEVNHNVNVFKSIEKDFKSVDAFVTGRSADEVVEALSDSKSKYKLNQMSEILVCEYLRSVGIDIVKPNLCIRRMLGADRLGISNKKTASCYEEIKEFSRLSKETGLRAEDLDFLFTRYCDESDIGICSEKPKCDKCVIREYCNRMF